MHVKCVLCVQDRDEDEDDDNDEEDGEYSDTEAADMQLAAGKSCEIIMQQKTDIERDVM